MANGSARTIIRPGDRSQCSRMSSTEDDFQKLQVAWSLIRERGPSSTYILTGLEHSLPLAIDELPFADDELAPALCFERLKKLALEHLGGSPETDDVAVFNRLTGATMATHLTLVKPGDVVIGVSASYSHPSVVRAAGHVEAQFIDTAGIDAFRDPEIICVRVQRRLCCTGELPDARLSLRSPAWQKSPCCGFATRYLAGAG
jgi:hypothetical protein